MREVFDELGIDVAIVLLVAIVENDGQGPCIKVPYRRIGLGAH